MNTKIDLKKLTLKRNGHFLGYGNGPDSDWKVIFTSLFTLLLIAIAAGLVIFLQVNSGKLFSAVPESDSQPVRLNTALLERTVSYYQDKASSTEKIKVSKEVVKDPSL